MTDLPEVESAELIPPLPEDRSILSLRSLAERVLDKPLLHTAVGAMGAAPALVARALLNARAKHVIYVATDIDAARQAAADLAALSTGLPLAGFESAAHARDPILLTASESSPYAEVHADRRMTMLR